ncbi:hypothetical protein AJ80_04723 [Polytolypa hystricis UAMH7299]|uniref:Brix domain-containing protein n=1 Tax=Polytolypa hystricis (strain UAMH7299) TaxID=1447883 RepID=A0A2B7Y8Z2_POLH7|nr:hypothetical protein AJ80_04723 [Polytolypa hystricis UAMH7299]
MAAVYKALAKKKSRASLNAAHEDEEDVSMMDLVDDPDFSSDSDEDEWDEEDEEDEGAEGESGDEAEDKSSSAGAKSTPSSLFMPKTRVLMLTSRGVTHRHRHLLADLTALLPHTHKESKLDTKKKTAGYNFLLNSLAELHSCNVIFFLEARKHGQDLYLWLARPPNGPTIKFAVTNLHTMGELGTGFAGNCLKGGRGVVVFDKSFDDGEVMRTGNEWRGLVREMLRSVFCVPKRGARGVKPFIDRVIGVYYVDGKVWIRVFEIRETDGEAANVPGAQKQAAATDNVVDGETDEKAKKKKKDKKSSRTRDGPNISLVEIGPRLVLTPIVILEGSFGGPVIYENKEYVSSNQVRRELRLKRAGRYAGRQADQTDRDVKKSSLGLTTEGKGNVERDDLDSRVLFK